MKHWYASKTIWFNVLAVAVIVASAFGYTGEVSQDLTPYLPLIQAVVNIILRSVTNQPVGK